MKKTIVLLSALEPWSMKTGAGAPSLYETIKGYSDNGFQITYITYQKYVQKLNISHSQNIDLDLPGLNTLRVKKIKGPIFFGPRFLGKLNRLYYEPKTLLNALEDYLNNLEETPSILYAYEAQAVHAISMLKRKYKDKSIVVNRFQGTILGNRYREYFYCLRKYEMFRILRNKADKYIMTNDGTHGDEALKYWNANVNDNNLLFIRNGFNFQSFQKTKSRTATIGELGLDPKNFYAFTVSRLTYWKRVDRAIGLIEKFAKKHPKLHLIVVGEGEHKLDLIELAESKGVSDKVHFIGAQSREKVAELMQALDVFLSLYDVSNLGNPLFEAMICGQCIITLDNGTTKEVIEHNKNGIIVSPDNKSDLQKEFETLLMNEEKRIRLKKTAKAWAERNLQSWSNRMKKEIDWIQNGP
ncbi:Alpha-monoglucosyldiacylglycerol synthase [Flagellimonas maritima]|uniref:Alpha-monoglucosyldiacylglycerol synthase n=1 Tax=Flagellimonas maritima TaxID=1383885 RepID=A0A2Z4LS54_9FLAO|nr:glycosyltransferase [Allomuricauda aurantiaca]AWX44539.1 Alpha-monoglucosyldiacylglycerol synthase [Allomuricauda aurantiaca]